MKLADILASVHCSMLPKYTIDDTLITTKKDYAMSVESRSLGIQLSQGQLYIGWQYRGPARAIDDEGSYYHSSTFATRKVFSQQQLRFPDKPLHSGKGPHPKEAQLTPSPQPLLPGGAAVYH